MGVKEDYQQCYKFWCEKFGTYPLKGLMLRSKFSLVINVDTLTGKDWAPILKCLENFGSIKDLTIKSNRLLSYKKDKCQWKKSKLLDQQQSFCYHSIRDLFSSLGIHLSKSSKLIELKVIGIPIPTQAMKFLSEGISSKLCLKYLSFHNCILNDGVELLCNGLRRCSSLNWLSLSTCSLISSDISHIASLVTFQCLERHGGIWKESLRYSVPSLDKSEHLHRITLNDNPNIKDEGCFYLINALKEDLWLNALDLQNTGISDTGAEHWLKLLNVNITLEILDLRNNSISKFKLIDVEGKLEANNIGRPTRHKLLPVSKDMTNSKRPMYRKNIKLNTSHCSAKFSSQTEKKVIKALSNQLEKEKMAHNLTKEVLVEKNEYIKKLLNELSAAKDSALDEDSLNKIENSLKKFHMFVDMLRETNLCNLVQPMLEHCIKTVDNVPTNYSGDDSYELSLNDLTWKKFKELALKS